MSETKKLSQSEAKFTIKGGNIYCKDRKPCYDKVRQS